MHHVLNYQSFFYSLGKPAVSHRVKTTVWETYLSQHANSRYNLFSDTCQVANTLSILKNFRRFFCRATRRVLTRIFPQSVQVICEFHFNIFKAINLLHHETCLLSFELESYTVLKADFQLANMTLFIWFNFSVMFLVAILALLFFIFH